MNPARSLIRLGRLGLPTQNGLCFFDDHISQVLRIEQARSCGFTNLIFDDNLPVHGLHGDGSPPFPTVDVVFNDDFAQGEVIEWEIMNTNFQYRVSKAELAVPRA